MIQNNNDTREIFAQVGNISDLKYRHLQDTDCERLKISRVEMQKRILRKRAERGTDVIINLDSGKLSHGDILENGQSKVILEQLAEKVITIYLKPNTANTITIILGHIIGNRHRPISIKNNTVTFPIQADSELETFEKLFVDILEYIEMKIENQIFIPHSSADVHEH